MINSMTQPVLKDYTLSPEQVPLVPSLALPEAERQQLKEQIKARLKALDAVLVAHYYVDGDIQELAEETGGCVADSLEMARFGRDHSAQTLIVSGVRFMGETAKILSPEKQVFMPTLQAECSLDLGCPPEAFADFIKQHEDRTVVVYANTSARVKALADWVVTSSCALEIVSALDRAGRRFSGHRINISGVIFKTKPKPICCFGVAPAWSMRNLRLKLWKICGESIPMLVSSCIPNHLQGL